MDRHAGTSEQAFLDLGVPRFIGRDAELDRVTRALVHSSALVLVEGEAGIGKSRLVHEALRAHGAAEGFGRRSLVAVCPPFREALTLGPIVDAARQACSGVTGLGLSALAGALRPLFPEWADCLPPTPELLSDPGAARHRLIRALAELLERLGVEILVVEDVHWADDTTLDFLVFLASRRPRRISLVLTYRPEDVPPDSLLLRLSSRPSAADGSARVVLGALNVPHTADLVSSMLDGEQVSGAFASFLHERTEGVPLALEECVRLLRDRSDLIRRDGEWVRRTLEEITVPPTIRDSVSERVSRLDADAQQVLLAAAVLGDPAEPTVLAAVADLPCPRADAALDEAVRSGLVAEDPAGRVAFRHVLAARAVHDRASRPERRAAHRRAAAVLETLRPAPVARLAHHFRTAGDGVKWCQYAEQAADLALATGDHQAAVALLHELLTDPALPGTDVARIAQKMPFLAFTGTPRGNDVVEALRAVLAGGRLGVLDRGEVRSQLARILKHIGEYAAGAAELERAVPDLADNPLAAVRAMTALGGPAGGTLWPASTHRRWLDRAAAVSDPTMSDNDRQALLIDRVTALLDLGEPLGWELAAGLSRDESTPQAALESARGALNTGNAAMRWGRYTDAASLLATAAEMAERHRYQRLRDIALMTLMHLDWFTGAWTGLAERLVDWTGLEGEPLIRLDALLVTGLLGAAAGDDESVEGALRLVRDESTQRGIVDMPMEPTAALARLGLARGEVDAALALTEQAVHIVVRKGIWLWGTEIVPVRVEALAAAGRGSEAENLVTAFAQGLRRYDAPASRAALATCHGILAEAGREYGRAADLWGTAAVAWQQLPRPYDALLARERRAGCLLANSGTGSGTGTGTGSEGGGSAEVLAELSAVGRELTLLGAGADAERVVRTLREHGVVTRGTWRGGRRGYGDQLSPREQEVVQLLLTGLTNREIAGALSRSPKTVAAQLNSAMRKHGVSSRTALAVSVAQAGNATPERPTD